MARSTNSGPSSKRPPGASSGRSDAPRGQLELVPITDLVPDPDNPRLHNRAQIRAIAKSIETFGFNAPILVDKGKKIVAGHGRYEAARSLGLTLAPIIRLEHLTAAQAKAYMLADNKLTDRSTWDDGKVAVRLKELSELPGGFDVEATGFELPEIDYRIQSLDDPEVADDADQFGQAEGVPVSMPGDLWILDDHRLYCGDSRNPASYTLLLEGEKAAGVVTDPPYNVKIDGHVSGNGANKHREFAMASGEMSEGEFVAFLTTVLELLAENRGNRLLRNGLAPHRRDPRRQPRRQVGLPEPLRLGEGQRRHGLLLPQPPRTRLCVQEWQRTSREQRAARPVRPQSPKRLELPRRQ
jgi:ParB-like nuclease domain